MDGHREPPSARTRLAAALGANGEIYAIGGNGVSGAASSEVDAYNIATNSWSVVASLPTAYALSAVEGADDQIYAIGGSLGVDSSSEVDAYNPLTNTWTTTPSLPLDRQGRARRPSRTDSSWRSAESTPRPTRTRPRSIRSTWRPTARPHPDR